MVFLTFAARRVFHRTVVVYSILEPPFKNKSVYASKYLIYANMYVHRRGYVNVPWC